MKRKISFILALFLMFTNTLTFSLSNEIIKMDKDIFEEDLKDITDTILKKYEDCGKIGFYIQEINTGFEYGYNDKDIEFDSKTGTFHGGYNAASVVKLYLAFATYKIIEDGILDINENYFEPYNNQLLNLSRDIPFMIETSSNDIHNFIIRILQSKGLHNMKTYDIDGLKWNRFESVLNETLSKYGFSNLKIYGEIGPAIGRSSENNYVRYGVDRGGRLNPYEIGKLLEYIYKNKNTNSYMNDLHNSMLNCSNTSRIPKGIEYKYPVAHKTGTYSGGGVYNDVGIIYVENNPYILSFISNKTNEKTANSIVREIAKEVTIYMEKRTDKNMILVSINNSSFNKKSDISWIEKKILFKEFLINSMF